jgi:hypothetical protein
LQRPTIIEAAPGGADLGTVRAATQETTMKKMLVMGALLGACGVALAHNCPNEMKAIDAKLATSPKLAEADMAKVKQLRAEGEAAHKAGKHDDSMKALGEAKKMLGL